MEEELQDIQEQLRISCQNVKRLESELRQTKEQLNAERKRAQEQAMAAYIDTAIQFGG